MAEMRVRYLGQNISYEQGMQEMRRAMADVDTVGPQLLLLEHQDTITTTRQHGQKHLLVSAQELANREIQLLETDRGGDVTFHGKGQLVGYPVLRLPASKGPLDYVRMLEAALVAACQRLGLHNVTTRAGFTGIWIGEKKLIAIGVGISKGVTRHGFALNIRTNLQRFTDCIIPCGLSGFGVTNLETEYHAMGEKMPNDDKILGVVAEEVCKALQNSEKGRLSRTIS